MLLNLLKAKIHRARITEANLEYEGSITIDKSLLEAAGILPHEQVHVCDITNGNRFITYIIEGPAGSGCFCVNGAAARLVSPGDKIIVISYCQIDSEEAKSFEPRVVLMDDKNQVKHIHNLTTGTPAKPGTPLKNKIR